MDDRLRHSLSDEQHQRIFQNEIRPVYFRQGEPLPAIPTGIILGGQPGAGKSALLVAADKQLRPGGRTVVINGDDLRSFHPAYERLQTSDPFNAARYTDQDSGRWVEKLIAAATAERFNMVIESTMRQPEVFQATAGALLSNGYRVEAHVLAVSERLSWQGVHLRYETMLSQGAAARFTVREAHDAGAAGMLVTLRTIEREHLAHRVLIADRSRQVLYDNRLMDGIWQHPSRAADVVGEERWRPRTPDERQAIDATWHHVIAMMTKRGASDTAIKEVGDIARADAVYFAQVASGDHDPATRAPTPLMERYQTWRDNFRAEKAKQAEQAGEPDRSDKQGQPTRGKTRSSDPSP